MGSLDADLMSYPKSFYTIAKFCTTKQKKIQNAYLLSNIISVYQIDDLIILIFVRIFIVYLIVLVVHLVNTNA